jgi:hypothetical protein
MKEADTASRLSKERGEAGRTKVRELGRGVFFV